MQHPRQIETAHSAEALITLSPKLQLDVNDIIGQQLAAFGMPGFGKTNAAVLTCEQIGAYYVPMAVFDKEGDWLSVAGVLPRGVIATKSNCPSGRDILNQGLQVIYDLSTWDSLASAAEMIVSVVNELMAWASARPSHERIPCLIVLDEAHTWLPEKRGVSLPKEVYGKLFDTFQLVGSTGRKRGLTPFYMCPKISELNKGVLYPGLMYFFRATLHTDVARYLDYIHSNMYTPQGLREVIASLPKGKAIVKLPSGGNTSVKFNKRESEHVSHTPTVQAALNRYASMPFDANGSYGMDMPEAEQEPEPRVQPVDEEWMNLKDAALYIGRSRTTFGQALTKYQQITGKEIEKMGDGIHKMIRKSDIDELVKLLYPMEARQKGLL
jgi:hypothetical protein